MDVNTIKIIFRRIKRQGIYTVINIFGLGVGIATFILIGLWIMHELSYERFYTKAGNIHQVYKSFLIGNDIDYNSSLPYPLGKTLVEEIPEVIQMTRLIRDASLISFGDLHFNENSIAGVDTSYFSIFDHKFIFGNPAIALKKPFNVVITRDISEKYFGTPDGIGRVLEFDHDKQYVVSGVIENIPDNTYLNYNILIPIETVMQDDPDVDNWYSHFILTYIVLPPETDLGGLHEKLTLHIRKYLEEDAAIELVTQPITQKHLYDLTDNNNRSQYVRTFLIVAILILLIACINYMNLSSAISMKRSREIGLRKVVGASRFKISIQILLESLLQTLAALLLALTFIEILRPLFNDMSGKSLYIPYEEAWFILTITILTLSTAFISGLYPSLLLSSYKPAEVFRGKVLAGKGPAFFRKILVLIQFSIATSLIICSLLIYDQLTFVIQKDIGFDPENLISIPIDGNLADKYEPFRNDLIQHPGVINVCRTSQLPSHIWNIMRGVSWEGNESTEPHAFGFAAVDYDYINTVGLELSSGRFFQKEFSTDTANYIINESAARMMGFEEAVGKSMGSEEMDGKIIGVVKDFNSLPLQYEKEPLLMKLMPDYYWRILIRVHPDERDKTIAFIEKAWNDYVPGFPFEYVFIDERIRNSYTSESRIGKLALSFTLLAILLTCIGLFGLASHMAQQRTKEIGIRKVFGASLLSILKMFIKNFAGWVLLSNLIAWPLAYFFIDNWLDNFAYRVDIAWYIFVVSAIIALLIAVLTVTYQSILAARRNPVNSLRYE